MIKVTCKMCKKELDEPGAILFGVPGDIPRNIYIPIGQDQTELVMKHHICIECYDKLIDFIEQY